MKLLISGGGTGGHVFPAIAIADAVKNLNPEAEILFVGALGKLEMTKVPEAGYKIIGLPIRGLQRKWSLENLKLVYRLIKSLWMSFKIINKFKPDVVLGVGGYASGPVLRIASWLGFNTMIQEQNSYPGITNKILSKASSKIFVAFSGMDKYFNESKIVLTGNPVRQDLTLIKNKLDGLRYFNLEPNKITIGVLGGSLGAGAINQTMLNCYDAILERSDIQWIWQAGAIYQKKISEHPISNCNAVKVLPFIDRMDLFYAACDLIVSRAGALTLAELSLTGKPCILIPSPNVAEDHQRKNAEAFVENEAAIMIEEVDLNEAVWKNIMDLVENESKRMHMSEQLKKLSKPDAANEIARYIINAKTV